MRQRVDPVPHMPGLVPAKLAQWMEDRQADLQEALSLDDTSRILELTSKLSEGGRTVGGDERWHVAMTSRYGLRGVRVGEASNPGPVQTRSTRRLAEPSQDTTQDRVRADVANHQEAAPASASVALVLGQ